MKFQALLQEGNAKTVTYLAYRGRREHYSIVCVCSKVTLFLNVTKKLLCVTKQAHLCDITSHLIQLNKQLQGMSELIFYMLNAVVLFQMKLILLTNQLQEANSHIFPNVWRTCTSGTEIVQRHIAESGV